MPLQLHPALLTTVHSLLSPVSLLSPLATALAIAVTGFASQAALAATQVQTFDLTVGWGSGANVPYTFSEGYCSPPGTCYNEVSTDWFFLASGFDPGLGSLQQVTLEMSGTVSGSNEFEQGANGAWFTPGYSLEQGLTLPTHSGIGDGVSFAAPSCDAAVLAGGTCTIEYEFPLYDLRMYTEPSLLAGVTTAGDIQLYLTADFVLRYQDGSDDGNAATFDTLFTLTYHYVPEPGTATLLALGLVVAASVGAGARRRA